MHEMSLCESILRIIENQATDQHFQKVKTVWLEVGALAGVELEALRFGFDVVMKESVAEGARLEIIEIPGEAWCMNCMKNVEVTQRFDACPECGSYQLQMNRGEELQLKELEVE